MPSPASTVADRQTHAIGDGAGPAETGEPAAPTRPADGDFTWPAGMLVLIPVYNHGRTVARIAREALELGAPVLVIDDGSTDGSGDAAAAVGAEVVRLEPNQGKARALSHGMALAEEQGYDRVLTCDADGQHPISEVERVARGASDPRALYLGCRDMRGAPGISRFGRFCSNFWSWVMCGIWLGDTQSGLRVYPLPAVNRLRVRAGRYSFEIEVLIRAVWSRIAVHPIAVEVLYPEDRVSHFNKFTDNLRPFGLFARLLLTRLAPGRRRLRLDDETHT